MRHSASLLTSLEGVSLAAFRVARELAANGRSGLTVRFLSKKLEMAEEEIEYILDLNHRLLFMDLTKVKIVAEGQTVVKRICEGLENHGDIPTMLRRIKGLAALEFRRIEELLDLDGNTTKKDAGELLLERFYKHPDSVVSMVATRGFSNTAREIFDLVWQSKDGILPISKIRAAHGGSDYQVEQALQELFQGFALFELFRFDAEDRLVRVAALLKEVRQYREANQGTGGERIKLKPVKNPPAQGEQRQLRLSDALCRLAAAIAARPARLRGDGDLFREDRRRLGEIVSEEDEPSLSYCLWMLESMGWLTRVDNTLQAGKLDALLNASRTDRHLLVYSWLTSQRELVEQRRVLTTMLDYIKPGQWYDVAEFADFAMQAALEDEQPTLKNMGNAYRYVTPGSASQADNRLARSLEEAFFWLGVVERAGTPGGAMIRLSKLGEALLLGQPIDSEEDREPPRSQFVVQPNFDIVVPTQDMDPLLTVPLDQFAVRTSSGAATVYHLSKDSFTQAVQEGHDAAAFVEFLVRHNRDEALPRNVSLTLEDWMGGIKRVRMRQVWVVESPDALVMADLLHRRRFRKYIAPADPRTTGFVTDELPRDEFVKMLEKEGFIVEEAPPSSQG